MEIGMFDEVTAIRTGANGKPLSEFEDACKQFRKAHKKFEQWSQEVNKHGDKWSKSEWWAALRFLSETEQRVERIFIGVAEPTQKCRAQYAMFREFFLEGKPTVPNC